MDSPEPSVAEARADELELALADAYAKSRMMHLLALLVGVICDSDASDTPFDADDFRTRWEKPCVDRLRDQQVEGKMSHLVAQEVDVFCDFLDQTIPLLPLMEVGKRERVTRICWDAVNEVSRKHAAFHAQLTSNPPE